MNTQNLIEGLSLLQEYRNDKTGYYTGAEHEIVYAYPTDKPLSRTAVIRMLELGWDQTLIQGRPDKYDVTESWVAYV